MLNQIVNVALLPIRLARRLVALPLRKVRPEPRREAPASRVPGPGVPPPPRPSVPLVDDTGPTAPRARAKAAVSRSGNGPAVTAKRVAGPTPGEAARLRAAQREAEGDPEGPGPTVHVAPPWDGYDGMTAQQIVARLKQADDAEAAVVALYEASHKNRATVVAAATRKR
jgi:hypothetical protein